MMEPGRDRLDGAIDEAARQLVTGTMPRSLVRSVLTAIAEEAPQRPAIGLRVAAAAATLIVAASMYTYVRDSPGRQEPPAVTSAVARRAPQIGGAGDVMVANVISRKILDRGTPIDRGPLPKPVRVALISVAPVTMPAVELESFSVDPVEVARVEVLPVGFQSPEGIR